jgi:D-lactate dehydrogenase
MPTITGVSMSLPAAYLAAVEHLIPADRRFDDPLST